MKTISKVPNGIRVDSEHHSFFVHMTDEDQNAHAQRIKKFLEEHQPDTLQFWEFPESGDVIAILHNDAGKMRG